MTHLFLMSDVQTRTRFNCPSSTHSVWTVESL